MIREVGDVVLCAPARAFELASRIVYDRERCVFYVADKFPRTADRCDAVREFRTWADLPRHFRRSALRFRFLDIMYYRLRRHRAVIVCYSEDGISLKGYSWIQRWEPFRRKFGAIAGSGVMVGPCWTSPDARGQGIYPQLMLHCLGLGPDGAPAYIYTSPENTSSQAGIEKAGFRKLGVWEVVTWFRIFVRSRRVDNDPALSSGAQEDECGNRMQESPCR